MSVVIEIIVAIFYILRLGTLCQCRHKDTLFLRRHIDVLLMDSATEIAILSKEITIVIHHHHIVRQAKDKAEYEITLRRIEGTVVDGNIHILLRINNSYRRMTIETIYLIMRLTRHEIHLNRVIRLRLCITIEAKAYKKNLKK